MRTCVTDITTNCTANNRSNNGKVDLIWSKGLLNCLPNRRHYNDGHNNNQEDFKQSQHDHAFIHGKRGFFRSKNQNG
ncbi:Uncharacterised protein [Klebsiella pneumoniae]|nr:Uncharacterised protein [Klebsiella pneumoniae]